MDTIFALASAPGKAGVSIIRVSGRLAEHVCRALAGSVPEPRKAILKTLRDARGVFIDDALVLFFKAPTSFTGEDVVEFQCHGSVAVIRAMLSELGAMDGVRVAEPGEFTRRALDNGRMDLTQVEALSDLIEAETESQRQQALRNLSGALSDRIRQWRQNLVRAASLLEAVIDFADEDVPEDVAPEVLSLIEAVKADMQQELSGLSAAERVRTGFEIAIVGPPNAGKSTLLNRLAGREAALTSERAGTTRDVIEVRMDVGGFAVTILDTAGLREADDEIEALGISLARKRAGEADMRVHLLPAGGEPLLDVLEGDIVRIPKADTGEEGGVSGLTGAGVDELLAEIKFWLENTSPSSSLVNRERHRAAMVVGVSYLETAWNFVNEGPTRYDVACDEIRQSLRRLEGILGHVDVEHLLDEIFASFCLGK